MLTFSRGIKMKNLHSKEKGMTLIKWIIVIFIFAVIAFLIITAWHTMHPFRRVRKRMYLVDLHKMFMIYKQDYGCYPSTLPPETRYEKSGGVRDLYPLYSSGLLNARELNKLLHPKLAKNLLDFSENPTIDEFDKYHIGYAYNSTAKTNCPDDTPILALQGVSDGVLNYKTKDKGTKPILKGKVLVLFANGNVEYIKADRKGVLSTNKISAEMWKKLVD